MIIKPAWASRIPDYEDVMTVKAGKQRKRKILARWVDEVNEAALIMGIRK